ncbi:MAG: polysaccharide biosynthesis protein [Paracoccus sp. (in: a-proteobacteria)]|nr:polysaccharide biosynthesis protein [Paracoccus sp. (in: a-proteobacteria)]
MISSTISELKGKRVVITGGVGSVGRAIFDKLAASEIAHLRVIDNNETALFEMEIEMAHAARPGGPAVDFFHCDITDAHALRRCLTGMDLCFHCAGLKHVTSCERSPFSAIRVNIEGSETLGRVAQSLGLEKVIFTSSDKAVNPSTIMGTSKLMAERLFTAMNFLSDAPGATIFASVRFGNVLGSRGSVVPLFARQIAAGGPVRITDERMTRFVMTTSEAADLVIESMVLAHGGEVFITKMPVLRITDLARVMIDRLAPLYGRSPGEIDTHFTGARAGEKLWEELSSNEESGRQLESERFLIILPAGHTPEQRRQKYAYERIATAPSSVVYHSSHQGVIDEDAIWLLLTKDDVLPVEVTALLQQSAPG